ncbi:MAG: lipocalin family protein [Flavobacteriaceae bacterium]
MKKVLFLTTLFFFGCKPHPVDYIEFINGYWEIENVYKNGKLLKEFKISQEIDYFRINNDLSGFRKKLKPNFNGSYTTSKDQLNFKLEIKFNKRLIIVYEDNNTIFVEEITKVNKTNLSIKNDKGMVYNYKVYKPLELN